MSFLPGAVFVTDTHKERSAILESRKLNIPVVGVVDSNSNPEEIDYPIPGNDDAIRSIRLFASLIANAVIEGREGKVETGEQVVGPIEENPEEILKEELKVKDLEK